MLIDSQRASLEAEIASLEARLLELRSQLNSLSTINCLPTDILLEIIKLVRGAPSSNFGWIRGITDICSQWRSVALGQRELWTTVFLSPKHVKQQDPIFALLSRADDSPLTLHAPSSSLLVRDKRIEPYGIHPHALRGLHITTCPSLQHLSQIFRVADSIEAPWLQTLKIDVCTEKFGAVPEFMKFLSESCPSLQRLYIPSLSFVSTDLKALKLTHLSLLETSDRLPPESQHERLVPYDVLASLTHCAGLRHLALSGVYLEYYEQFLPSSQLILPLLSSVTLAKAEIRSAINVLEFIASPSAFDVSCNQMGMVHKFSAVDREKPILELVTELVKIMLGCCRSQGSHLFLYDGMVRGQPYNYGFRLEENSHSILNITLTSGSNYGPAERYGALLAPLNPTPFTLISLEGIALNISNLPFFGACTASSIIAIPRGNLDLFTLDTPPGATAIPFPYLKNIEIFYVYGNDFTRLTSIFWWRYRRGLPLPRLVLVESGEFDPQHIGWTLLPLITNGTFITESSGDLYQLPDLDFDDIPSIDTQSGWSEWDKEVESNQDTDDYDEREGGELSDSYGAWLLRPDETLLEDEDSGDDFVQADSDLDSDSD